MNHTVIKVENLSKQYRLGLVGTGSLGHDLNRWWAKLRGRPDPYLKIGESNDRSQQGDSEYVWALKDINFEVKQGEVLGIIGRNGAGKSTLLKILSRVTAPTTGNVKIKGRVASLLEIGTGFHPELTGRENIYLNGAINGMTKAEVAKKLDEIVDFSGCERYIDTPVKRYSSGMTVRLGFSVAAHLEAEILIVDEVLAVGDAEFQKKCIGKMKDVAGHGRTVLFVSHNMAAVENLCNTGLLLSDGRLKSTDSASNIISTYLQSKHRNSSVLLNEREDREGGHLFKFTSIKMNNDSNEINNSNEVFCGGPLTITLSYTSKAEVKNAVCYIGFYDLRGVQILNLNTKIVQQDYNKLPKEGRFICHIDMLPLSPGDYYINVGMVGDGGLLDRVESATSISIIPADFYKSGRLPGKNEGYFVLGHSWKLLS